MDITKMFKSFSPLELSLLILFIIYLVLPINTPNCLKGPVESPLGLVTILGVTLYLFFYAKPILAILYVFVAYEILRRSAVKTGHVAMVQFTPKQKTKDAEMAAMNPPPNDVLEIDVISKMAPIGESNIAEYASSSYSPMFEDVKDASKY